jgi:hypothetical protein
MGQGNKGNDSSISFNSTNIYLAKGGGAGHHDVSTGNSNKDGGSGGGSGGTTVGLAVSTNIPAGTYGNSGGIITSSGGGGGGGALTSGGNGTNSTGGSGGNGKTITITGTSIVYGGGGGGGGGYLGAAAGTGGEGGGGPGSSGTATATNGTDGTGGGGGGGGFWDGSNGAGGKGGSGIVIIRYSTTKISIIENGNVGIGITPLTNSSLLEVAGDVNIIGNYKRNNRDIILDTSNYVLSTSNILLSRILTDVRNTSNYISTINTSLNTRINDTSNYMLSTSNILANRSNSQWTSTSTGIYYNTPISTTITLPNEIGVEKIMVFTYTGDTISGSGQTQYTVNVPTGGITCDILMVAGGGAGGAFIGPGGGGGAVLYGTNINIPSGVYTINVGRGGTSADTKGFNTQGFGATLLGGGCALSSFYATALSNSGGSGSGGQSEASTFKSGGGVGTSSKGTILNNSLLYNGNIGGSGVTQGPAPQQPVSSGGGGGAGSAGQVGTADNTQRSAGGNGVLVNITGANLYWGAGGGGGSYNTSSGNGGLGGGGGGVIYSYGYSGTTGTVGGSAYSYAANPINAGNGTGSGGGGGSDGGLGGSGIIIIKYNTIQQTIQKSISSSLIVSPTITTGITTGTIGATDGYMMFTYTTDNTGLGQTRYALNITQNIICDFLIVGGGGGGARRFGGGGGAGALIYDSNLLQAGTYYIHVGNGGAGNSRAGNISDTGNTVDNKRAQNGFDSEIFYVQNSSMTPTTIYRAKGGGGGLGGNSATSTTIFPNEFSPLVGGSGGGNGGKDGASGGLLTTLNVVNGVQVSVINNIASDSVNPSYVGGKCFGNEGGRGGGDSPWLGSGGGGAGSRGADVNTLGNATTNNFAGVGGIGLQYSITGSNVYYAGGGGGGNWDTSGSAFYNDGGLGGGGRSSTKTVAPVAGAPNTGGGGGGDGADIFSGANGGSGVVIIKYYSIQQTLQQYLSFSPVITPTTITGITTGTFGTTDSFMMFTYTIDNTGTGQTQYTINIKENIICDILIVGGGGGGGKFGGGGGGGGILFGTNISLNTGTYSIRVGDGGAGDATSDDTTDGINGYDSSITINSFQYIAKGGGGGGSRGVSSRGRNGVAGGSGGGGSGSNDGAFIGYGGISNKNIYDIFQSFGNNGGQGKPDLTGSPGFSSGGGGGAGSAGSNFSTTTGGGNGGAGKDFISYFGTTVGHNGWFGGGGGGNTYLNAGNRAFGNGGNGFFGGGGSGGFETDTIGELSGDDGIANTGGGGGGSIWNGVGIFGGKGGSGVVIIRYRKNTTTAYVGLGTTNPISELHVNDDTVNNTKLIIQNNYIEPVVVTPNTGYTITETLESNIYYRTLTFTYSPNYPENPPNATLLAWYRLNGDGLDYNPSSTKYDLTPVSGTPSYSSDFFQGRRYFAYSSSSLGNTLLQLRYRAFSASLWVRPKTGTGTYIWQYGYYDTGGTLYLGTASWTSPNNQYGIDVYNRGAYTSTQYPGDTNNWIHLVYIMDTNYSKRVYRNGTLIAINEAGDAFVGSGTLQILSNAADISDVRIYTTGLTNTDVEKLYFSYMNNSFTNNYSINFANTTDILVNGTSKTVKGLYNISTGHINSSMLPLGGQTDTPLASTATTTVTIKYPYNTPFPILPNEINVGNDIMIFTYTGDTVASSGQTQYTITVPTGGVVCDILIVAGGGGGGMNSGGGGGAGGLIFLQNITLNGTYTINIGRGGNGGTQIANDTLAENGKNTSLGSYIAIGGGAGVNSGGANGNSGGSGGGAANGLSGNRVGGAGTAGQGFKGGDGTIPGGSDRTGGGGGGAGGEGQISVSTSQGGYGGIGRNMTPFLGRIYGVNGWFAGGGGGGGGQGTGGIGGTGGGGNGGIQNQEGINGTGGGGGGAHGNQSTLGKKGGSGIIIIKNYTIEKSITSSPQITGITKGIIGTTDRTISFTYTTETFGNSGQTLYSFRPVQNIVCDILVVGGGGGGGRFGGGGGGGGVLFGVNLKLNSGSNVIVKVGNGGTGATTVNSGINGVNGFDSSIIINSVEYIAKGGGGGGSRNNSPYSGKNGNDGGSGGGGSTGENSAQSLGGISNKNNYANFQSFGNNGGKGKADTSGSPGYASAGGGGAGSVGSDFSSISGGGNGGFGKEFIAYFGRSVGHNGYFAGGGGGNTYYNAGNRGYGNGGLELFGGGGNAGFDGTMAYFADNGMANTGGGGGGGNHNTYTNHSSSGGNGGSGFVIIRYRINTMQTSSIELNRTVAPPNEIVIAGTTSTVIGNDRCIIFPYTSDSTGLVGQTQYTFTTTEPLICDILIVGGGGGGGCDRAGGGGAGGLVFQTNILLNGIINVLVGRGGIASVNDTTTGGNGSSSSINSIIALGGGGGGSEQTNANNGGSGGGSAYSFSLSHFGTGYQPSSTSGGYGNRGGDARDLTNTTINRGCGGGGGAGTRGLEATSLVGGAGGDGLAGVENFDFKTHFNLPINNTIGQYIAEENKVYFAGGGGGGDCVDGTTNPSPHGLGGKGGGANGNTNANIRGTALANSGGGGGGGRTDGQLPIGSNGGSGIVIIRYRRNTGYKIGNYNGDFKIISTLSSTDTDYMRITRDGASIYNPTGTPLWSTVSDRRIKENIEKASYDKCYDNINKLELYRFNYIKELNNINKDNKQLGYIAQEVEDIFPKAISTQQFYNNSLSISDLLSIDISQINYTLYGSVKKLINMYNDIEKRVEVLEKILNIENDLDIISPDISITNNSNIDILTANNISFYIPPETNILVDTLTTSNIIDTLTVNTMSTYTSNIIIYDISTSNNISFYTQSEANIIGIIKLNTSNITV